MTEEQKYQGALYKDKTKKQKNEPTSTPTNNQVAKKMPQAAYVEDAGEDGEYGTWADYDGPTDDEKSPAEPPPEAPTPPSAVPEEHVNVFDFLVATGQTPNASNLDLPGKPDADSTSLVRYEYNAEAYLDMDDEVEYGAGPIPTSALRTPAAKIERRKTGSETKKDKKRKRLHVDVPGDQVMTDAPPVLHSGLTGGLKGLMRSGLPPSPDYSGGDGPEGSPASPLKKTKHSKRSERTSTGLLGMITGSKSKSAKKRKTSSSSKKHSSRSAREDNLIEYRPHSKDGKGEQGDGQVILYKPRADVFLGFIDKGPESERGCSMNKALKRFHRERKASGDSTSRSEEEKELWRSLRMRQNDRGEIVLFTV